MNTLTHLISDRLIYSLGWTIIHSLWQIALVTMAFALLLVFLRRCDARTRYIWGLVCLVLIMVISLITFTNLYTSYATPGVEGRTIPLGLVPATESTNPAVGTSSTNSAFMSWFTANFTHHLPLVVTVWLFGILILVLRFAGGVVYNQRLRGYGIRKVSKAWQEHLAEMCRGLGLTRPVSILESSRINIPLTTGHLKPVIIVPVGMLAGLPYHQVDALIAHELAHILRRDYLINMVQSMVEILFFFHPGVRWISSNIRNERENCCDDLAVSISGDSINFARALTSLQAGKMARLKIAMAATGKQPRLLRRIKRLLLDPPSRSQTLTGFIGSLGVILCVLAMTLGANALSAVNHGMNDAEKEQGERVVSHDVDGGPSAQDKQEKGESQEKREKKRVEEQIRRLKERLYRMEEEEALKSKAEKRRMEDQLKKMVEIRRAFENQGKSLSKAQKQKLTEIKAVIAIMKERVSERLEKEKIKQSLLSEIEERERLEITESLRRQEIQLREQQEKEQALRLAQEKALAENLEKMRTQDEEMRANEEKMSRLEKERVAQLERQVKMKEEKQKQMLEKIEQKQAEMRQKEAKMNRLVDQFLQHLYQDKLMRREKKKRIRLTGEGLYIGGAKQPDRFHKKYLDLYEKLFGSPLLAGQKFLIDP